MCAAATSWFPSPVHERRLCDPGVRAEGRGTVLDTLEGPGCELSEEAATSGSCLPAGGVPVGRHQWPLTGSLTAPCVFLDVGEPTGFDGTAGRHLYTCMYVELLPM